MGDQEKKPWKNAFFGSRKPPAGPDPRQLSLFGLPSQVPPSDGGGAAVPLGAESASFEPPTEDAVLGDEIIPPLVACESLDEVPEPALPPVVRELASEPDAPALPPEPEPRGEPEAAELAQAPAVPAATIAQHAGGAPPSRPESRPALPDEKWARFGFLLTIWLHRMRAGLEQRGGDVMQAVNGCALHIARGEMQAWSEKSEPWVTADRAQLVEFTRDAVASIWSSDLQGIARFSVFESMGRLLVQLGISNEADTKKSLEALKKRLKSGDGAAAEVESVARKEHQKPKEKTKKGKS
jgi:hypothetical protein